MAYEDYDDELESTGELLETVNKSLSELEERLQKVAKSVEDTTAGLKAEVVQSRRDLAEMRVTLVRLQNRFDNQLVALILANIASGLGVAALVLGAARAL